MFFIGVISKKNKYDLLKEMLQKSCNMNKVSLISINSRSINNLKNVRFDSIVILDSIKKMDLDKNESNNLENLKEICAKTKYLLLDSDIKIETNIFNNIKLNIITFGLNHKSSITISSITDESILISVQRAFENIKGNIFEVGEYNEIIDNKFSKNIKVILSFFIIKSITKV